MLNLITSDAKNYVFFGSSDREATLHIKSWQVVTNIAAKGDVGFAESYRDGLFETDNLANLIILALKNSHMLDQYLYGNGLSSLVSQIMYALRSNSLRGSKRNIHAHYDLGNDFYALWLDPSMTYSAALFKQADEPLEQAQHNKYDRII